MLSGSVWREPESIRTGMFWDSQHRGAHVCGGRGGREIPSAAQSQRVSVQLLGIEESNPRQRVKSESKSSIRVKELNPR